ncbi:MAG: AMP-binding protein [Phaeodactylibacter sp.]|uniref:AMP-binding protein n=1 Tax=Phaeodactylibacter sp. TaxID=1940289 RepID=UPI0032ECC3E1
MDNLVALLQQRAEAQPDFTPFIFLKDGEAEEQPLSHREFNEKAMRVAAQLQRLNLKGARLLLLFPQGNEYLIALFGCFYAGAIAVPAYPPRNNRNLLRLEAIMEDCGAVHILADQKTVEQMQGMDGHFSNYTYLVFEELVNEKQVWSPHPVKAQDIAYLQYTSGSTGNPKGVIIRHENVMANVKGCMELYIPGLRRVVSWIPLYHDMGLIMMIAYLVSGGVQCYFMAPVHFVQKPYRWLAALSRYRAEYTVAPNFAFDLCCEKITQEQLGKLDLSSLKSIACGSEPVRWRTLQRFFEKFRAAGLSPVGFLPSFGMAEATLAITTCPLDREVLVTNRERRKALLKWDDPGIAESAPENWVVSNGRPVDKCLVRIVDPKTLQQQAEGDEGEILVQYPGSVASGYWGRPESSVATFGNTLESTAGQWLRTGDLGFLLKGELFITGRIKDMIIVRGENYYPTDIEQVVERAHPALQANGCAAFAVDNPAGERLVIVQEVRRSEWRSADEEAVVGAIRQVIGATFEIQPYAIVLIRPMSLPKTSSGKIQRYAAREAYLSEQLRVMHHWQQPVDAETPTQTIAEPGSEGFGQADIVRCLQQQIAEKVKMPIDQIEAGQPVKAYPLESVDAVFISDALSDWLKIRLAPDTFWAFDSIQELAEHLLQRYQNKHS